MSEAKLKFVFTPPERGTVLPIKLDREKWFAIADQNNTLRASELRRCWYRHEVEELYSDLYPA